MFELFMSQEGQHQTQNHVPGSLRSHWFKSAWIKFEDIQSWLSDPKAIVLDEIMFRKNLSLSKRGM